MDSVLSWLSLSETEHTASLPRPAARPQMNQPCILRSPIHAATPQCRPPRSQSFRKNEYAEVFVRPHRSPLLGFPGPKINSSDPPLPAIRTAYPTHHSRRSFTTNRVGRRATTWPYRPGSVDRPPCDLLCREKCGLIVIRFYELERGVAHLCC